MEDYKSEYKSEYESLLHVDRSRMTEMLDTQPSRYIWAVELSAAADAEVRKLEQKLKVTEAETFIRLKSIPDVKTGKPMTDTGVSKIIAGEPPMMEAVGAINLAKHDARILNGVVESFQQRKTMLAKSVEREVMGYYGDPNGKGQKERFQDNTEDHLRGSMRG